MKRKTTNLIACCSLLLVASCSNGGSGSPEGNQSEDNPFNEVLSDSDELDIIAIIKRRTEQDGAKYNFDQLEPVFADADGSIEVTFSYTDQNITGGAPVAVVSRSSRDIVSITYTR